MPYPKLIEDVPERWRPLFRAMYFHERQERGMLPDPSVPECPYCPHPNPSREEGVKV